MPRSRKSRNSQNQVKPEWGKNNPQTKAKNQKMLIVVGVIAVAAVVLGAFLVFGTGLFAVPSVSPSPSPSVTPAVTSSPSPTSSGTPAPAATPLTSPAGEYSANGTRVLLETSMGNITIQLRDDKPITTSNFLNLVNQGLYDGTIFHRVMAGFMIQGGVIQQNLPSIANEIGTDNHNFNGTIAMANTGPNTASSSFFINVNDNNKSPGFDDSAYAVFGRVIGGMDVVMNISHVAVGASPYMPGETSSPLQTITLLKAIVLP